MSNYYTKLGSGWIVVAPRESVRQVTIGGAGVWIITTDDQVQYRLVVNRKQD